MRSINKSSLGKDLIFLLNEEHPIDEDIGILNENGEVVAAVITKEAYEFFLKKLKKQKMK